MSASTSTHEIQKHPIGSALYEADHTMKSISIIVACRNETAYLQNFLDSLSSQDLAGFDWEVLIADGCSTDGTRQMLEQAALHCPRLQLIDNPSKIVSTGLNAAIAVARGEIVLRMDAHTDYAKNYVKKCVETLEETGASNVGGPARTRAEGPRARAIQAAYHSRFSTGGARFHDVGFSGFVDTVPYGCWRKDTLERLGLFDEQLVRNQDDELNLRIIRGGGTIWQSSEIVSWYHPRSTFASLFRQYFQYGFWKVRVIRKHKVPASWRHLIPGTFVFANLLLVLSILGLVAFGHSNIARNILYLEAAILILYSSGCLAAAYVSARLHGWNLFRYLPGAFAVFHISYGLGFLSGLLLTPFNRMPQKDMRNLFEGVTR